MLNTSGLKVLQHNVLNWRTHQAALVNYYAQEDADILLLNAHGMKDSQPIKIPGYRVVQTNPSGELHDGSCIAFKSDMQVLVQPEKAGGYLSIQVPTGTETIAIATRYLPPRRPDADLVDILQTIADSHLPYYFLGDINASHQGFGDRNTDDRGKILNGFTQAKRVEHLGPHFNTFLSGDRRGTPDKVLTNNRGYLNVLLDQGPATTSDHVPIVATLSIRPISIPIRPRSSPKQCNWERYREYLQTYDPPSTGANWTPADLDAETQRLLDHLSEARRISTPTVDARTLPAPRKTPQIRKLEGQLNGILARLERGETARHITRRWTEKRQRLRTLYMAQRDVMWSELVDKLEKARTPGAFWRQVKRMMGRPTAPVTIKDVNDRPLHTPEETGQAFARKLEAQFSISPEENKKFDLEHQCQVEHEWRKRCPPTIAAATSADLPEDDWLQETFTVEEVKRTIASFREKSPGKSGITKRYLTAASESVKIAMTEIFNGALALGHFPLPFKHAEVVMIPKRKNATNVADYRPISLLEVPGKVLERLVNNRLQEHLEDKGVFQDAQFGFRRERGTLQAIAVAYETIAQARAKGRQVRVVLRDVKAAFDKVWHTGLKVKLARQELPPRTLKLLASFLDDRTAAVRHGNHTTEPFRAREGVPQGSILSPLLYNLYVADMPQSKNGRNIIFADDVSQIVTAQNRHSIQSKVEAEIFRVNDYERLWKIQTSVKKFTIVSLAPGHETMNYKVDQNHPPTIIEDSRQGRFLGLQLCRNGLSQAITQKARAGRHQIYSLHRFRQLKPKKKKHLYNFLVKSALLYPSVAWAALTDKNIQKLQSVQNVGVDFIGDFSRNQRRRARDKNQEVGLPALNISLHDQAKKVWSRLQETLPALHQELVTASVKLRKRFKPQWPSAYLRTLEDHQDTYTAREVTERHTT